VVVGVPISYGEVFSSKVIYTIGYGGRALEEFLELLKHFKITTIIDVRRWNTSQRQPEFSGRNLTEVLSRLRIEYHWVPELGGYRRFAVDVEDYGIARCFKAEGFRAYATYITMNSTVKPYLEKLVEIASATTTALLCCERTPWRCHRKILSDYLYARGFAVLHILGKEVVVRHRLSKCGAVIDGELKYF
jgi:uncharacterized protein (DUF488 family)